MNRNFLYLILILIASRFIGLPPNFSPMLAIAIFMPRLTDNKYLQSFIPVFIILLSNFFLEVVNPAIFLTMLAIFFFTPILSRAINNLLYSCLLVIFCWFVFVNGSVWVVSGGNFVKTYIGAVPFDFKLLISTGLYLSLFHYSELIYKQFDKTNQKLIDRFI